MIINLKKKKERKKLPNEKYFMFLLKFNCYCYISGVPIPFFFLLLEK